MPPSSRAQSSSRAPARRRNAEAAGSSVKSVRRALGLLVALAETHDGMTLSDLAQLVGLPSSSTHRLLTTLQELQFVRYDAEARSWQIGVQAYVVGNGFVRARDVAGLARPYLKRLMEASGETANLYTADDGEAICMAQIECRQMMRAIARPGGRVKMHCSGSGKAMLAFMPDEEVTSVLQKHGLTRVTDKTIATPRRLREDLGAIRARGYSIDDEEHAIGLRCVAAPIFDHDRQPIAAISVSAPLARVSDARVAELGALVSNIAADLTRALGGRAAG